MVTLILDGADITNSGGSALVINDAEAAVVQLADGSQNTLTDGTETATDEPNPALFSTADLTITGTGALTVHGNANDGITSKDGLVIEAGTITVAAVDDGIRSK
ncbi:MAG TPA: carbohydrate-binding domain-containing protein, partial [Nakamurella sp.]